MNSAHQYEAQETLRELRNEFNRNYKKFLEMSLLESIIENAVSTEPTTTSGDNKTSKLEDKIKDKYLKSVLISTYNTNPDKDPQLIEEFSVDDFKTSPLDLEAKSHLVDKIQEEIETRLSKIGNFITDPNEQTDPHHMETMHKFHQLIEQIHTFKQASIKANDDIKIKHEHCLNVAYEVAKLLNVILQKFRLGFYADENKERCENKILEFKVLLGKILSSKASILADVYEEDKLKALRKISDQVDLKSNLTKENFERVNSLVNSYNSIGKEFDPVLSTYKQVKAELDRKQFTLNTLKSTNI